MTETEERLNKIEERNKRVEADKAWERSPIRIGLIILLTYLVALLYLWIADTTSPFLGALIPCIGFLLSTLSLKLVRKLWTKATKQKGKS